MGYRVEFLAEAEADLTRLDATVRERIFRRVKWLSENFESITPKPLSGEFKGYYKLRVGDYRVIYSVSAQSKLILIRLVGHRRDIYK
ncbi:MAG: type II toxin-antitoxin system RelE/ParE family toxin [Chloroflexi bacterium]|nr:type II toxin-antitoxin system RelE/ParE family toxin [Chloroflexota bacterium]